MIRILIVDDQHLFAESLKFVLQGEGAGSIEVVGIAENGTEAVTLSEQMSPDVVLMDVRMPVMDGVEATARIHDRFPDIKILILTTFDDDELAVDALSAGATGYVLKDVDPFDLILSIEAIAVGGFYVAPSVGQKLVEKAREESADSAITAEKAISILLREIPGITRREAQILYFVARAFTNKGVAAELNISEKTVKNHLSSIYEKLNIHNRLQVINYATTTLNHGRAE